MPNFIGDVILWKQSIVKSCGSDRNVFHIVFFCREPSSFAVCHTSCSVALQFFCWNLKLFKWMWRGRGHPIRAWTHLVAQSRQRQKQGHNRQQLHLSKRIGCVGKCPVCHPMASACPSLPAACPAHNLI